MTLEARLRIRHAECFTGELAPGMSAAQLSDEGEHSVFLASADSEDGLDALLESMRHTLTHYRLATRSKLTAVVQGACPPHGVENVIRSYGCAILWPAVFADGHERYRVLAPSRDRLKQLVERLGEMGGAVVESVAPAEADAVGASTRVGGVVGALTPRQLDILRTAVTEGYYASPRRTSTESLAGAFGISRATFEEHLRKAEVKVLESVVATIADLPASREPPAKRVRSKTRARAKA